MNKLLNIIALILLIIINFKCTSQKENTPVVQKSDAKLVKIQTVQTKKMVEKLQLPGSLEAENVANILSNVEGKITRLVVREGDKVQKEQVVAMLSSLLREDIITSARLLLQTKEEELEKSPDNIQLQEELHQARQDYQFALQQYKEIPVTSPMTGVVSQRWVDLGDMIQSKAKLFEIQSSNRMLAKVPVSELDIRKFKIGQIAEINADAWSEKSFRGTVQRIYPEIEKTTRNGIVEILLDQPQANLKPGMFVRITFITQVIENAMVIPLSAIIEKSEKKVCFIVEEGKAKEIELQTGLELDGWIEIRAGISAGDNVIVEGQEQIKNGTLVKIQETRKKSEKK